MSLQTILNDFQPRWSINYIKVTVGTAVVLAFTIPIIMVATPMIEFFNGMAAQPKGKAQMTYGRVYGEELLVARDPVKGPVPRGYTAYAFAHLGTEIEDAVKAGELQQNPVAMTRENLEQGQKLYNIYCIVCHGKEGHGDGSVTGPGRFPAPPSLHTDQARGYQDGTIYHILTKGVGKMPSYAYQIEAEDRWKTIHYVRALQRAMNPSAEDLKQ